MNGRLKVKVGAGFIKGETFGMERKPWEIGRFPAQLNQSKINKGLQSTYAEQSLPPGFHFRVYKSYTRQERERERRERRGA